MEVKEFKAFMEMIDQAYPKQQKLNKVQKGLFWITLQDKSLDESVQALASHTHSGEWKPQVCDIVKHLPNETLPIIETFSNFFNGVEVKDKIALEVFKLMGGNRLRKASLEKDYLGLELKFISLYKQKSTQERMVELPRDLKNKLIGLEES